MSELKKQGSEVNEVDQNLDTDKGEGGEETTTVKNEQEEKTFTQSEMEEIISKRVAREKKAAEKAVEQAEKLAKMNEDEKREFEFESLKKELEDLKRKDAYHGLSVEASKMLSDKGIKADKEILNFVVKDDAEETKSNVEAFSELISRKVEEGVKDALSGNSPRVNATRNNKLTKDSIMEIKDVTERIKAINENQDLFK